VDNWENISDKGLELLQRFQEELTHLINNQREPRIVDSDVSRLEEVGAGDFAQGEARVWEENKKGKIALMAYAMRQMHMGNIEVRQKLMDDLKKAREDSDVANRLLEKSFGTVNDKLFEVTTLLASMGAGKIPVVGGLVKQGISGLKEYRDGFKAAQDKKTCKKILLDNLDLIQKVKEKLDTTAITDRCKDGVDAARSLRDAGRGDYRAEDWEKFGEECRTKLEERRDLAIEVAQELFGNLRSEYVNATATAFAALLSDPSSLANWKGKIDDNTQKIYEQLAEEDQLVAGLHDGPFKTTAQSTMKDIRDEVNNQINSLKDTIKDAEELMKV
jgi:hypothetical protein